MKYMAIIDADEKPVSCEFIGCNGNVAPYLIGATTNIKPLEQEPCEDCIKIPERATNGDMIKVVFPNVEPKVVGYTEYIGDTEVNGREVVLGDRICIEEEWWNSPYRKEQE